MNIDETIDTFRRGAIDLDCKKMVLRQRKGGGPHFEGQGYIRQSQDGSLLFKLYVANYGNTKPTDHLDPWINAVAGALHSDDAFYDLTAVGHDGTNWTAARILPAIDWDMADNNALARGQLQSIVAHLKLPQPHCYLRLHFFEEYDVPLRFMSKTETHGAEYLVRDRAEFEACGSKFTVRKREGSGNTVVELTSDTAFPSAFHVRIQEALQYITGKTATWRVRLESEGDELVLELASLLRKSSRTQFWPPISPASIDFHNHGWDLFASYLAYVAKETRGTHWNPVAYHLYNACEATANSIDAWALGVSVAVEAVVDLIQMPTDATKADRLALFQERMCEYLETQGDLADLVSRMKRLINGMGERRPQDTLYALADIGHTERAYVDSWRYLRNRHAHPKLKDLKISDLPDNQKLFDNIHRVEVLLRQLTFYLIGYKGPFTDYGAKGFPTKQYPLAKSGVSRI